MRNVIENAKRVKQELLNMDQKQTVYPVMINDVKVFGKLITIRVKK